MLSTPGSLLQRARMALPAMVLLALAAGCASQVPGTAAPGSGASTVPSSGLATAQDPPPADGTDVAACLDGECEITLSGPVEIPLDGALGVDLIEITVLSGSTLEARADSSRSGVSSKVTNGGRVVSRGGSGGGGTVEVSRLQQGSVVTINEVSFRVVSLDGGTAVLDFSPA